MLELQPCSLAQSSSTHDVRLHVQQPVVPDIYEDAESGYCSERDTVHGFPSSLVKCTRLRRLSIDWLQSGAAQSAW